MKRFILSFTAALCLAATVFAGPHPELRFNDKGRLKILQMTDLHFKDANSPDGKEFLERMDHMVAAEQPDVLIFTGDLVLPTPSKDLWKEFVAKVDSYQIPWCMVYGNHDAEHITTRAEMSAIIAKGKYSLNTLNRKGELADVEIPVIDAKGKAGFYLYCMDSGDYNPDETVGGYASFTTAQVKWMADCCKARKAANGSIAPAMAFFHIPLNEYIDAWTPKNGMRNSGSGEVGCGTRGEVVCTSKLNPGMFHAMREGGSIIATFCGHDHNNDFMAIYEGIVLGYGRYSGCRTTTYNDLVPGCRVIVVENNSRAFETWIHDAFDRIRDKRTFTGEKFTKEPLWKD